MKNDYLVYGDDANALANEVCSLYATVTADALRLRSEPSEEADVVTTAANGDKLKVDKDTMAGLQFPHQEQLLMSKANMSVWH